LVFPRVASIPPFPYEKAINTLEFAEIECENHPPPAKSAPMPAVRMGPAIELFVSHVLESSMSLPGWFRQRRPLIGKNTEAAYGVVGHEAPRERKMKHDEAPGRVVEW
jgi:hypothetical protein